MRPERKGEPRRLRDGAQHGKPSESRVASATSESAATYCLVTASGGPALPQATPRRLPSWPPAAGDA
jgi:hypothetical protein